ncbi:type IV pilin protein [Candidatus Avelusimicrobium alvi]|uniref:type IV pilin protein n=1 Tax=Candidatus Avelusimicrobium alvi TaxID=3416221 RepID=UPI003D0A2F57
MNKRGFTLIELLVVVLIIGILASVAVPWYQSAVDSSRYTQLQVIVKSIKDAVELSRMMTGSYPATLENLDIELPSNCTLTGDKTVANCGKFFIDYMDGYSQNIVGMMNFDSNTFSAAGNYVAYVAWLDYADANSGRRECRAGASSERMQKLCADQPGTLDGTAGGNHCPSCKRYWLN